MNEIVEQYLRDEMELPLRGDYYETVEFFEDDDVTPEDTTDWNMVVEVRKSFPNGEFYDLLSVENGRITNTPASGQMNFGWSAAEVEAFDFTVAQFRMYVIYPIDFKQQVLRLGAVRVV